MQQGFDLVASAVGLRDLVVAADLVITGEGRLDSQTLEGKGSTLLARMFSLIYLGDWVSWHLAVLNKTNPTPVPVIQQLKTRLAKAR